MEVNKDHKLLADLDIVNMDSLQWKWFTVNDCCHNCGCEWILWCELSYRTILPSMWWSMFVNNSSFRTSSLVWAKAQLFRFRCSTVENLQMVVQTLSIQSDGAWADFWGPGRLISYISLTATILYKWLWRGLNTFRTAVHGSQVYLSWQNRHQLHVS